MHANEVPVYAGMVLILLWANTVKFLSASFERLAQFF